MTVRFCSRYPLGHRTHKNTHMKKVLCSPLPFACTLARKWGLVETKQNREVLPNFYYTYRHRTGSPRLMGPSQTKGDWVVNVDF